VLEAERIAQGRSEPEEPGAAASGAADQPWWLSDPALRDRYRR
jgi:hypothetical protein